MQQEPRVTRAALGLLTILAGACIASPPPPRSPRAPQVSAPAGEVSFPYQLTAGPAAEQLGVEVELPAGTTHLRAQRPLVPFIDDVEVASGADLVWKAALVDGSGWALPGCSRSGCRARYRVALGNAARGLDDQNFAAEHRGVFLAPMSSWLLSPSPYPARARYTLEVHTPPGIAFVTGNFPDDRAPDMYGGFVADLEDAPYAAFGPLSVKRITMPGGSLDIALTPGDPAIGRAEIERWVETQAHAIEDYFGSFPIPHAAVLLRLSRGRGTGNGMTTGNGGGSVTLSLGERSTLADLTDDWILVHELVHISFPDVHTGWAEEGLATYVEPLIRVRAGLLSQDTVWRDLIRGLPQGQPAQGDEGLDHTKTWGRRYWGGALYWFVADVEIRRRSGNTRSLDDALRRIVAQGGNVSVNWSLDQALSEGDLAVGGTVLRDLRRQLGQRPVAVDLNGLWKELGVGLGGRGRVTYDEGAPLAAVRRGITARGRPGGT